VRTPARRWVKIAHREEAVVEKCSHPLQYIKWGRNSVTGTQGKKALDVQNISEEFSC
jgi:hypothetical protein